MRSSEKPAEKIRIYNARTGQVELVERVVKTDAEWKKILTPEQYKIMRQKGTEPAFSGQCPRLPKGGQGVYQCAGCGTDLFLFSTKFESGTGWPSFWEPVSELNIELVTDNTLGMQRTEALCSRCGAHLGHVFDDGPKPTGKRYCINAVALVLAQIPDARVQHVEKAVFGAGCFWGVQSAFDAEKGVVQATAGYMGGTLKNPSYADVSTGQTGYAEVVLVEYDPAVIPYEKLLDLFWSIHDPTTPNRQGPDIGSQYRSVIFYFTPEQKKAAELSRAKRNASGEFDAPITTEIVPAKDFYKAEEYHQYYFKKQGITPTCGRLRKK